VPPSEPNLFAKMPTKPRLAAGLFFWSYSMIRILLARL
jgi:hypothetical protein